MSKNNSAEILLDIDPNMDINALILMYKDYTFLMHIACKKTSSFYNFIKLVLGGINLLLSASLACVESAYIDAPNHVDKLENRTLQNMNIIVKSSMVINFCVCIIMGLSYLLKLSEKELIFKINSDNYLRLNNAIISELSLNNRINREFIKFVLQEFHFLVENSVYDIPLFIKKKIKRNFSTYNIPPYIDVYNQRHRKTCIETFYKKSSKSIKHVKTPSPDTVNKNSKAYSISPLSGNSPLSKITTITKSYSIDSYKTYLTLQDFNTNISDIKNIYSQNEKKQSCDCSSYDINNENILSNVVICNNQIEPMSPIIYKSSNSIVNQSE